MTRKSNPASDSLRVDRWLFYCRFFKTRSKATATVTGGHVKVNGERTTPGNKVKQGDRIELVRDRLPYSLEVIDIPKAIVREREQMTAALRQDRMLMPKTDGRPDKHTRRKLRDRNRR
jgi:ribosome-associated heat shock protein Hsp15